MQTETTTGGKIAAERRKINLTQEQLADQLQVTRQSVSRWESDLAFPETEKLIKLSQLFDCSVDYLLRDEAPRHDDKKGNDRGCGSSEEACRTENGSRGAVYGNLLKDMFYEYRSKTELFGLPLIHVNVGFGRTAKGIIAIGIRAHGILSLGIFAMGVLSVGVFALGLFAFGVFALGLAVFASVGVGAFAGGAVAVGMVSWGAVSVGLFANGACAVAYYLAIGDVAYAQIAVGRSSAYGSVYSFVGTYAQMRESLPEINAAIGKCIPEFFRSLAQFQLDTCRWCFSSHAS